MMINLIYIQEELLDQHYNLIIEKINNYHSENKRFILREMLEDLDRYNSYYINKTKGIIETLIALGYIDIINLYHNGKNYIFICKKRIP